MGELSMKQFRVTNFRNIDDSGWIPVDRVSAFVGRNESGKTAILKALHKFNPATPEPFSPQHEFPRDRYTREFKNGKDWSVCSVEFTIGSTLRAKLATLTGDGIAPDTVIYTRYYDGHFDVTFNPLPTEDVPKGPEVVAALDTFRSGVMHLPASPEQEVEVQKIRTDLLTWADGWKDKFSTIENVRLEPAATELKTLREQSNGKAGPHTAELITQLHGALDLLIKRAKAQPSLARLDEQTKKHLPVLIYFDRYGVLDSAIYLPRFVQDLTEHPTSSRVRTINAMFKHVSLSGQELLNLGQSKAEAARIKGETVTPEMISEDRAKKDLRAIKCNSASIDISQRFSTWWKQRRHTIRYDVDGDFFRIWVADDRRPDVELELESRSQGFQWFFSFYLVFLVESEEGHKDSILLLDEPGLQLHPTAQQELIAFCEALSEKNQLFYTTHSPFLIDGEHLERVRPVTEDATGHSRITIGGWPADRETIFPLQAAAGYAMVRGLFKHKKNVLVEGMSDYLYLHGLSLLCNATGRNGLPEEIYVTPCGGAKMVGTIASLFLGQDVRPLILLDSDEAGRARRDALMKELYVGHLDQVIMLGDVFGIAADCEVEDLLGDTIVLAVVSTLLDRSIILHKEDRAKPTVVDRIKSATTRLGLELPDGWKAEVARRVVTQWATSKPDTIAADVLDRAQTLFKTIQERFPKPATA